MIRTAIKLALVALLANATWHFFSVYWAHYKFVDAVEVASQYRGDKSDYQVREKILELASQFDVPVTDENLALRQEEKHTIVDSSYIQPVEVLPGFKYPWRFTVHVDTYAMKPPKLDELPGPK